MHDPMVVAFEIRRPWARRDRAYDAQPGKPRWDVSTSPFWVLAGRGWYWPHMVTVWHVEPGGRDSGEVCRHYDRTQHPDGTWQTRLRHGWRWHVHHWRIQVGPLQALRRWALTRCAWCGGRSTKRDRVNVSHQWDAPRGLWWRGEAGLYHRDCSAIASAHRCCVCADPLCENHSSEYGPYGHCLRCGKLRAFGMTAVRAAVMRELAALPEGARRG